LGSLYAKDARKMLMKLTHDKGKKQSGLKGLKKYLGILNNKF